MVTFVGNDNTKKMIAFYIFKIIFDKDITPAVKRWVFDLLKKILDQWPRSQFVFSWRLVL